MVVFRVSVSVSVRHTCRGSVSFTNYSAPDRGTVYCGERVSLYVCVVHVCLSVCDHIFGTACAIFTKFSEFVTYGRGSVLLWRRSDTLRISCFADGVVFAHKLRLLDFAARLWLRR